MSSLSLFLRKSCFLPLLCLLVLALLPSPSRAAIQVSSYLRGGENDAGDRTGMVIATPDGWPSGSIYYSSDVSPEAAARTGSNRSMVFSDGETGISAISNYGSDNFGVEAWIKPAGDAGTRHIFGKGFPGLRGFGLLQSGGTLRSYIGKGYFGSVPVTPGLWTHVAFVRSSGTATLYVNGVAAGSATEDPEWSSWDEFAFGYVEDALSSIDNLNLAPVPCFRGSLDEARQFTFSAGEFSLDDLLIRAPQIRVEQASGTAVNPGDSLDFAATEPGSSSELTLNLKNTGVAALGFLKVTLDGADRSQFSMTPSVPGSLASGAGAMLTVRFSPVTSGTKKAVLHLTSNDPLLGLFGSFDISLRGRTGGREIRVELPDGTPLASGKVFGSTNFVSARIPAGLDTVQSVAVGYSHYLALKRDGTVAAWGNNNRGQAEVPKGLSGVTKIAAGDDFSIALKNDGSIVIWGTSASFLVPPAGLSGVVDIAAGTSHVVALKNDGTVVAWGGNSRGQSDVADLRGITGISASSQATFAVRDDGTVLLRGVMDSGGTVADLANVASFSGTNSTRLALLRDGTVKFLAYYYFSSLSFRPPADLSHVVAVATSQAAALALKDDGTLVTWAADAAYAQALTGLTGVRSIASGQFDVAAVGDSVVSFGDQTLSIPAPARAVTIRSAGTLPLAVSGVSVTGPDAGDFTISASSFPSTLPGGSGSGHFSISFTPHHLGVSNATLHVSNDDPYRSDFTLALTGNGVQPAPEISVFAADTELTSKATTPLTIPAAALGSTGEPRAFTIRNAGGLDLTGIAVNFTGDQAADFTIVSPPPASLAPGAAATFTVALAPHYLIGRVTAEMDIASNDANEKPFAVNLIGEASGAEIGVELAGHDDVLQTGVIRPYYYSSDPSLPRNLAGARSIALSGQGAAVRNDGTVVTWGSGLAPAGLTGVLSLAAGTSHILALKSDGTVVAWGSDSSGQCSVPEGLSGVVKIAAGSHSSYAVKADGSVVGWGTEGQGKVAVPPAVSGVVSLSSSPSHTVALKSDGTVVCWGDNSMGESTPPAGLNHVVAVFAWDQYQFSHYSMALKDDGSVVEWGYANFLPYYPGPSIESFVDFRYSIYTVGKFGQFPDVPPNLAVRSFAQNSSYSVILVDSRVDFGRQKPAAAASTQAFIVRNTGGLPLDLNGAEIVGGDGDFTVNAAGLPSSLPGITGSASFTVTFAPKSAGLKKATLRVKSSDKDESDFNIMLTGIGEVPPTSYAAWRELYLQDSYFRSGRYDDANSNDVTNIIEYALGGDPVANSAGPGVLPVSSFNSTGRLQFQFDRYPGRAGITVTAQAADSPAGPWTDVASSVNGAAYVSLVSGASVTESGSGESRQMIVSDFVPVTDPAHRARFMRLQVLETTP